jgi:hypothetical protein
MISGEPRNRREKASPGLGRRSLSLRHRPGQKTAPWKIALKRSRRDPAGDPAGGDCRVIGNLPAP